MEDKAEYAISPQFRASDLRAATLDRKIDIFEDQVQGWLLDQAKMLADSDATSAQHAGFAILTLLMTYVEAIACFLKGDTSRQKSPEFFTFGLKSIFPELSAQTVDAFYKDFYDEVRCGLLHQAMTRGKVSIVHANAAAIQAIVTPDGSVDQIQLDPWTFLGSVSKHFRDYLAQLRDPTYLDLRQKFEKWFDGRVVPNTRMHGTRALAPCKAPQAARTSTP